MSTPFLLRDLPGFFARFHCFSAEPFTIKKKKNAPYILVLVIFFVCLGLKGSHISSEKKTKKTPRAGKGTFNTCAKYQGLNLSKMVCTFGLLCGKRANMTASQRNY